MLIGLVGAAVIVFHGRLDAIAALTVEIGDLLILIAMAVWAGYTVAIRWKPVDLDPMAFMLALSGFTIPIMIPFYALELAEGKTFVPDATSLGIIVYHGVCSSVLAYLCWNQGVAVVGSARASLAQYLIPVFGAVLAMIILGETLAWYHYAGIVTIFAGIAIASARR
jgi:drug/metabolite transporter (DMT)-like permease